MYFHDKRKDTNIDEEFDNNKNILSSFLSFMSKYKKIILISLVIIILLIVMIVIFTNNEVTSIGKVENYLTLNGEETITIYQGEDYIEPGYTGYNSKDEDLTNEVKIETNLNTNIIGEYEILYTLNDINKVRNINVIEKPKEYTYIYLKSIGNSTTIYLKVGDKYIEPGYMVFSTSGTNLTEQVKVSGKVNTSKKGTYELVYSVVDSNNVTITKTRKVIVMDAEINLSLSTSGYTNGSVLINVGIIDEYFDYLILPNNQKVTKSSYEYEVTANGKYKFIVYNKKGMSKEASIEVKNIDKTAPTGSCTIDQYMDKSIIEISAKDASGIKNYEYNGKVYTSSKINLSSSINNAKISIYDNANNVKSINCTVIPKAYISSINKDGVIITINAKKVNNEIAGYYFSYTNKRPNKNTGGYLKTNKTTIDVVRLPGTTYVWVEDTKGKISDYKTVTLSNDVLFKTNGSSYKILKDTSLDNFLSNKGWSIDEYNKLIARSARAAGLYTREAAATSAVALQTVVAQKYKIRLPYQVGGKSWDYGATARWGKFKKNATDDNGNTYQQHYGLDCSGFTTWAYVNAGYKIIDPETGKNDYPSWFWGWQKKGYKPTKENGEIGDFLANKGHVKLIIGKTDKAFITAESMGTNYGMVISTFKYTSSSDYMIQKAELLTSEYGTVSMSEYPTGF